MSEKDKMNKVLIVLFWLFVLGCCVLVYYSSVDSICGSVCPSSDNLSTCNDADIYGAQICSCRKMCPSYMDSINVTAEVCANLTPGCVWGAAWFNPRYKDSYCDDDMYYSHLSNWIEREKWYGRCLNDTCENLYGKVKE